MHTMLRKVSKTFLSVERHDPLGLSSSYFPARWPRASRRRRNPSPRPTGAAREGPKIFAPRTVNRPGNGRRSLGQLSGFAALAATYAKRQLREPGKLHRSSLLFQEI